MKTIKDKKHNLEWKVEDEGEMSWYEAIGLELTDGWRVPTIKELLTLISYENHNPALRKKFLKFACPSLFYWSASPYAGNSDDAWGVGFYYGYSYHYGKYKSKYVRLVRDLK